MFLWDSLRATDKPAVSLGEWGLAQEAVQSADSMTKGNISESRGAGSTSQLYS